MNKLSEIINKSRQTRNEEINKRRQTPNQIILKGRKTPSLMINTGRQTPNQYLLSKTITTTTTVADSPFKSISSKRNKEIFGNSSTTITSRRNQNLVSTLPQIKETLGNRRELGSNQTTSILTNMKKIEPLNIKNQRYDFNTVTITNERHLRNEKSTPALRGGVTKSIIDIKKPLNTSTQTSEILKNNLSTISIFDTGKKPKRQYILNERKTDVIQPKNRIRLTYATNPDNRDFINTDFNLRSKIVQNLSKEHNNSTYLPNTVYHEINETKKHEKKQVQVAPRKYYIIKTKRKPYKYTYSISDSTEQPLFRNTIKTTTITDNSNSLIRGRNINTDSYNKSSYLNSKNNYLTGLNLTSSQNFYTKTKYEPMSYKSKYETNTTITSRINDLRNNRNINKVRNTPLTSGNNSKTNLFKATEKRIISTTNRNEGRFNRILNDSGNKNNLNSNKVIAIKTSKITTDSGKKNDIGINKDNNIANYLKNEEKITKIVIEGTTSSVQNSGSDALNLLKEAKDVELGNKDENKVDLIKKQVSSTITTKEIRIESSDGSGTQVQQSRFIRMEKKEE